MVSTEQVLAALETRFDYHSARVIFAEAARKAGILESAKSLTPQEVRLIADTLPTLASRVESVANALKSLAIEEEKPTVAEQEQLHQEDTVELGEIPSHVEETEPSVQEEAQRRKKKK